MKPLVSVIIPTHNRSNTLRLAIYSALNQTYKQIEIIVIDDHSTDATEEVVREFIVDHGNLFYYKLQEGNGACAARNEGIKRSRGRFIVGLDDDDEFTTDRIEVLLNSYSPDYVFVFSAFTFIYEENNVMKLKQYFRYKQEISQSDLLWCNYVGNQVLVLKDSLLAVGGFDLNQTCNQDWDLWVRLLADGGKALYLPESLQYIHVNRTRVSITQHANRKSGLELFYKKYNSKMSFWQRHFFHFREYRNCGGKFSIWMLLSCVVYLFYSLKKIKRL